MKGKSKKQKSRNTKKQKYIKLAITLSIVIVIILFCNFQNKHLETTHYTYAAEQLGADLEGYRIVQISDLHNAKFGKNNQKLVDRIRECEPDMIVLTGDLVDSNYTNVDRAVQFVDEIVKICPVYYVTGNHEYWLEKSEFVERFPELSLFFKAYSLLDSEMICIFPYFCPYAESAREIREIFS